MYLHTFVIMEMGCQILQYFVIVSSMVAIE